MQVFTQFWCTGRQVDEEQEEDQVKTTGIKAGHYTKITECFATHKKKPHERKS
ncbi:hypothetical protein D9M68_579130 [compost metagenome]